MSPAVSPLTEISAEPKRLLLIGAPNVGKSVLFGALTGTYVTVSNYPGTTVEVTYGNAQFADAEVLDTPGTNHLVPMSEDEMVTRDIVLKESNATLVQVGDAKNLTRTLLLTLQLMELGRPFVLVLNMMDEAATRGVTIDTAKLEAALPGVSVRTTAAIRGIGVPELLTLLKSRVESGDHGALGKPLQFTPDLEVAVAAIAAEIPQEPKRALATMVLSGDRGFGGSLEHLVPLKARELGTAYGKKIREAHRVPPFALLSKERLTRAQTIARECTTVGTGSRELTQAAPPVWQSVAVASLMTLIGGVVYDSALGKFVGPASRVDPLDEFGFFDIAGRMLSSALFRGWTLPGLLGMALLFPLTFLLTRKHRELRASIWKGSFALAAGYGAYTIACVAQLLTKSDMTSLAVHVGGIAALALLVQFVRGKDGDDAKASRVIGSYATHPRWGLPILFVVLFYAYKVVGVFGAGTAVDALENKVFGSVVTDGLVNDDAPKVPKDTAAKDAEDGAMRLVMSPGATPDERIVTTQKKANGEWADEPNVRVQFDPKPISHEAAGATHRVHVSNPVTTAKVFSGYLNSWAFSFFTWMNLSFLTALFVGKYGLLTMGVTYAMAIVMPVVATFFFVFSMLEDSGYLPRLAVMANRLLRTIGLNGKAVLPMVLGLGCDTMATLTARIMETKKERVLVTLLLALGIPCSSQLSVVFAMMQRTSKLATVVWMFVVLFTIFVVGWVSAKVVPGDKSDFLLEMPPIRRPTVGNLISKTLARIEWYLKEAAPLFVAGTALLFFLDKFSLLDAVHRAGEPIVYHLLGFQREGGVADRVSEALLVGFLRRDFGAAGLLAMTRGGHLSPADVAVSMVTITLFIPCIANVFMIAKERGMKVAAMMCAFIFPYAILIGALVRVFFRMIGRA